MPADNQLLKWNLENYFKEKKIPIWIFDPGYEVVYTNFTTPAILNLMESMRSIAKSFKPAHSIEGYHLYLENPYEMYFAYSYDVGKHVSDTVIVGPVVTVKPTDRIWKSLSFGGNLFAEQKRILSHSLPVLDPDDFKLEIIGFFNDILKIAPPDLGVGEDSESPAAAKMRKDLTSAENSELLLSCEEFEELCHTEDRFYFYVTNGSTYRLYALFNDEKAMSCLFPNKANYGECMFRAIELLTMAKLACNESGGDKKVSHARFLKYAKELKSAKTYEKIYSVLQDATIEFARSSHDLNAYTSEAYSPMTNKCIQRIIERLPDKICLDELAKELHISAKYLSALFNKDTGSSITDFMQDIRVNEAKRLLIHTELSYLEISNILNFSSQSYFNCIFKKKTDLTPKEFREKSKQGSSEQMM